jgi:mannosylglycoprotein endo-beta-mannosidase
MLMIPYSWGKPQRQIFGRSKPSFEDLSLLQVSRSILVKVKSWVNISDDFLGEAERFLHCSRASLLFTYLGLPVGANARKISTWQPLIDTIYKKLGTWNNRWVSIGGKVVLLNSVLNSISFSSSLIKRCP